MKWFNLKKNICPQCNKSWVNNLTFINGTLIHGCGFSITTKKYQQIVSGMVMKDLEEPEVDE